MNRKCSGIIIPNLLVWIILSGFILNISVVAECCESHVKPEYLEFDRHKKECKEIIAMNTVTAGEYNLHMKIRDPSRHGVQVLFICEPGYQYTYHHPQTGDPMAFTIEQRVIGVTSINDKPPETMKPGNVLTGAGISYGTNDCPTLMYTNPTQYAWDDFDWIRYAYQKAETEEEAVELLTKDAVDELHATGIGETLYVVGPNKGYAIEADAYYYHVEEIKDIYIKSNYPEFLWDVCSSDQYKYAPQFDTMFDDWVREYQPIKLGPKCTLGVMIRDIGGDYIIAKALPGDGEEVKVNLGENQSLGGFRVGLKGISGFSEDSPLQQKKAHVTICFHYLEWLDHVYKRVNKRKGDITIADLMNWSRLHSDEDLEGLRGFCEGGENDEEAVTIFRHPIKSSEIMSSLWFSGIPCSSIYVPVHVSALDIYEPYKSGAAWEITFELLNNYGHGNLKSWLEKIESVIIAENDEIEELCYELLNRLNRTKVIEFLTFSDFMLQATGYKMEQILLNLSQIVRPLERRGSDAVDIADVYNSINEMWSTDYTQTIKGMESTIKKIHSYNQNTESDKTLDNIIGGILDIMKTAASSKINQAECVVSEKNEGLKKSKKLYEQGLEETKDGHATHAADKFSKAFQIANSLVLGKDYERDKDNQIWANNSFWIVSGIIILVVIICAGYSIKRRRD